MKITVENGRMTAIPENEGDVAVLVAMSRVSKRQEADATNMRMFPPKRRRGYIRKPHKTQKAWTPEQAEIVALHLERKSNMREIEKDPRLVINHTPIGIYSFVRRFKNGVLPKRLRKQL